MQTVTLFYSLIVLKNSNGTDFLLNFYGSKAACEVNKGRGQTKHMWLHSSDLVWK